MNTYEQIVQHFVNSALVTTAQASILLEMAVEIDDTAKSVRREATELADYMRVVARDVEESGAFSNLDANVLNRGSAQRLAEYGVRLATLKATFRGTFKAVTGRTFTSACCAHEAAHEVATTAAI